MQSWSPRRKSGHDPADVFRFREVGVSRGEPGQTLTGLLLLVVVVGCSKPPPNQASIDWTTKPPTPAPPSPSVRESQTAKASAKPGVARAESQPATPSMRERIPTSARATGRDGRGGSAESAGAGPGGAGAAGSSGSGSSPAGDDPDSVGSADTGIPDPGGARSPPPPPALPGRGPRRPSLPPDEAADLATANLGQARSALRSADIDKATQLALEAYDAVAPHAPVNRECGELCADAGKFLESVARKNGRAAEQPTRFD